MEWTQPRRENIDKHRRMENKRNDIQENEWIYNIAWIQV